MSKYLRLLWYHNLVVVACGECVKNTFFFFKTKNCLNDDPFISCNDRIEKMLHNKCISAVAISLR